MTAQTLLYVRVGAVEFGPNTLAKRADPVAPVGTLKLLAIEDLQGVELRVRQFRQVVAVSWVDASSCPVQNLRHLLNKLRLR